MSEIKRVGVLTGGGDCPGLNAVIRAVVKNALYHGISVCGIEDGFLGLIENRTRELTHTDVSGILHIGGTILGSNNKADPTRFAVGRTPEGKPVFQDMTDVCMKHIHDNNIDALVVIGGDGTQTIASRFSDRGLNCVGVPKTIDNDLFGTDITFGFMTAVETATEAIDRVRTTAASHHRAMVVEVMGRNAGWIALHAGLASGSDVILLPEIPFDFEVVCRHVLRRSARGSRFSIIVCAEGAMPSGGKQSVERVDLTSADPIRLGGIGKFVADQIEQRTGIESRYAVLGHLQRGGTPAAADRVLATQFGDHAFKLLISGKRNRLVVMQAGQLTDVDMKDVANKQRKVPLDHALLATARSVGAVFGNEQDVEHERTRIMSVYQ